MIKNIIFDFGGVLVDWNPAYLYSKVFADKEEMDYFLNEICTTEWNSKQDAGRSLAEATEELLVKFPKYSNQIEMFYGNWQAMLGGAINENVALLKPLKEKYKLYGLTNWSAETLPEAFNIFPFFQEFEGVVVSGAEKLVKPDAQIYKVLLSRYKLKASECLFIDDNKDNIEAAEILGFHTIHFTRGVNLENELQQLILI